MKPLALIIEDDPAIRESLADRLESLGHDCHAAGNQNEAGERIECFEMSVGVLAHGRAAAHRVKELRASMGIL